MAASKTDGSFLDINEVARQERQIVLGPTAFENLTHVDGEGLVLGGKRVALPLLPLLLTGVQ